MNAIPLPVLTQAVAALQMVRTLGYGKTALTWDQWDQVMTAHIELSVLLNQILERLPQVEVSHAE